MTIQFFLDDENETQITSFYDLTSNPFKIGDEVLLTVDDLYPVHYSKLKPKVKEQIIENNTELHSKFNRKTVKLVSEGKYLRFTAIGEPKLTIEYHCILIGDKTI